MNYLIAITTAALSVSVLLYLIDRETRRRDADARRLANNTHRRAEQFQRDHYTRKR